MGALFRSEEVCLVQLFLQSGSAYNCVSELGELGLVEFRNVNPHVTLFQRKFVNEVQRCEEMEKTFSFLQETIGRSLSPALIGPLPAPSPALSSPQPKDLLAIEEESKRVARELREVSRNRVSLSTQLMLLSQYRGVLIQTHTLTIPQTPPTPQPLESSSLLDHTLDTHLSFVAGVVHPWKVTAFERLLWRACRGYVIVDFRQMEEKLETPVTGEMVQWTIFLISFWGKTIGQKVKKICDCFHTNTFFYPESIAEREEILRGLEGRIGDITTVLSQTESYLQQLLSSCVSLLPQWKVRVGKYKAIHTVLNLCSPSVTEKCLIAEAWCPARKLLLLQSALIEGTRRSASTVDSFYNRLPLSASSSPPTLFITNSFTAGFQSIVDAYGVAKYREANPAVYTTVTFPFLFAVMFGDVGHGLLIVAVALWVILAKGAGNKGAHCETEWCRMVYGGRYVILLMGLFSVYTGAIYNDFFSRSLHLFPSGWRVQPMNWSNETLRGSVYLSLDPNVTDVFLGPYPFGIDPVWHLANNQLSFLNSYKMKVSIILGVLHMTFGVCLSYFNYREWSSVLFLLVPKLLFLLSLIGYLLFLIVYKWVAFGPAQSDRAPSIIVSFINMFLLPNGGSEHPPLYRGQFVVQQVLVATALASIPVLLLGEPLYLCYRHRRRRCNSSEREEHPPVRDTSSINSLLGDLEGGRTKEEAEEEQEFDVAEVFVNQAIHTIDYCLGCVSNTASYLRLWALSLAHAQLSDVLWVMLMRTALSWQSMLGSVVLALIFPLFTVLTVSILLIMEGLSAFLHALRLHWVEFQNKFYSGTGHKLSPFSFSSVNSGH